MSDINLPDLVAKIRINDSGLDAATNKVGGFGKTLGTAAVAGGVIAAAAVGVFAKKSIEAFSEAEQAQVKLADAFGKFPALAGANIAEFQKLNVVLAQKTRFDDDATAAAQASLAQFGLTGDQLKTLTPLVQDFAARTGQDLPSAAEAVGKALLGQGRALKQVGIDFQDTGNFAGNLEQVTAGLRTQVGGFAEKEGKTAAGQAAILKNTFGELQETVGAALLPALTALVPALTPIIEAMGPVLGEIAKALAPIMAEVAKALVEILVALLPLIPPLAQLLLAFVPLIPPLTKIIVLMVNALVPVLIPVIKFITELAGVIVGALTGALKGIIKFLEPVVDVFKNIGKFIGDVVDGIGKFIDKLKKIKLPDWLTPGSPSPFELSLSRTVGLLKKVGGAMPDAFGGSLALAGGGSIGAATSAALAPAAPTGGSLTLTVPLTLDGKQIAQATAVFTRDELLKLQRRNVSTGLT